jgi:hypothetical protein
MPATIFNCYKRSKNQMPIINKLRTAGVFATVLASALLWGAPVLAEESNRAPTSLARPALVIELNGASLDDVTGGEVGFGARFGNDRFYLTPIIGGFSYEDNDDFYRSETFADGREVCRDIRNGRFADKDNCAPAVDFYGKLEVGVDFTQRFSIGAGLRIGDETVPYGRVGIGLGDTIQIQAFGGEGYSGLGLLGRF